MKSNGENDGIFSVENTPLFVTEERCRYASRTLQERAAASVPALHIFQHERVILTYYLFLLTDGPDTYMGSSRYLFPFPDHFS